jgi:hypothetical protein
VTAVVPRDTIKLTLYKSEGLWPHINILYPRFVTNPGVWDVNVHVCFGRRVELKIRTLGEGKSE